MHFVAWVDFAFDFLQNYVISKIIFSKIIQ